MSVSFQGLRASTKASANAKRHTHSKNTRHELLLRSALTRIGVRYRLYGSGIAGRPDLVFSRVRVVVFCDGDFWHGRQWDSLKRSLGRGANAQYWVSKIHGNIKRDRLLNKSLIQEGWGVIRMWERDIRASPDGAARAVAEVLGLRGAKPEGRLYDAQHMGRKIYRMD